MEDDPLSYLELEKYGYSDLVAPIMKAGGYVTVSREVRKLVATGGAPTTRTHGLL